MVNIAAAMLLHRNLTASRERRKSSESSRTQRETARRNPSAVSHKLEAAYQQAPVLSAEERLDKAIAGGMNLVSGHSKQYFYNWDYCLNDEQAAILFGRAEWVEKHPAKALEILSDDKGLQAKQKDKIPQLLDAGEKANPAAALEALVKMTEYTAENPDAFFDFAGKVQEKCSPDRFYNMVFKADNAAVLKQNPDRAFELLSGVMAQDTDKKLQNKCARTLMSLYRAAPDNEKIGRALYDMRSGGTRQENLAMRKTMRQALDEIVKDGKSPQADSALNGLTKLKFPGIDPAKAVLRKSRER